jgi:glycosyltransferase involved in cell wall biosynthesis
MTQPPLRLLMFNLMTDASDPVLGFTTAWIRELAKHCKTIDVITMYQGELDVPDNVRVFSAGRERGLSKPIRVLNFYRHLVSLLFTRRYDVCFAHMMPLFAGLAGPLLAARGIRTVLWYTHRQKSTQLKWGLKLSWRAVSAVSTSFPYETPKLRVIGHGINTDFYAPTRQGYQPQPIEGHPVIIQVARLASIKHQETTLRAVAQTQAHLILVGDVQAGYPKEYKHDLEAMAQTLNMAHRITFTGDLNATAVRDGFQQSAIAVNMSPVGLFDKSALESMACGVPTIVCNPEFAHLMGDYQELLIVDNPQDVEGLRDRINRLLSMSDEDRATIGQTLRDNVVKQYSLSELIQRLVDVLRTGECVF